MAGGLREALGLPEINHPEPSTGNEGFGKDFRAGLAGVNQDMQVMAVQASQADHQKLDGQRQNLIAAYQTASAQGDPGANERVIAAVGKAKEIVASKAAGVTAGRDAWQKREADFDAAVVKIGELEDAGHPKAGTYRALSNKILAQANGHDYKQASAILDQLGPKLDEAHGLYVQSSADNVPGGKSGRGPRKTKLPDLPQLKELIPDLEARKAFGEWVKSAHDEGDLGEELEEGDRRARSDDPHEHYSKKRSPRLEAMVEEWKAAGTPGLKNSELKQKYKPKPADPKGGKGGGGGDGGTNSGGSGNSNGGTTSGGSSNSGATGSKPGPTTPPAPQSPTTRQNVPDVDALVRRAEAAEKVFKEFQLKQDKGADVSKEAKTLKAEAPAIKSDIEAELKRLATHPDMAGIGGSSPKQTFDNARRTNQGGSGGGTVGIVLRLADAYEMVQDIQYILEANSALEGVGRSLEVAGNYAQDAATFAVVKYITRSGPMAVAFPFFNALCDGSECKRQEDEARQKAQKQQTAEEARLKNRTIGAFLAKHVPGSVRWLEDHYQVLNQKVWDAAVRRIEQLRRQNIDENETKSSQRARELGFKDGKAGDDRTHKDEIEDWPEVKKALSPIIESSRLLSDYEEGFKKGNAKRAAVFDRATRLGYRDGKAGGKIHFDEMVNWPEVKELVQEGAMVAELYPKLFAAYNDAYNAVALTAGERVERDKKAAALKRARELGSKDGKSGKPTHVDEIRTWPEVQMSGANDAEAGARSALLSELLNAYHKAYTEAAKAAPNSAAKVK